MAIPATGTTFDLGGFTQVDNRFFTRGGLAAVLIRDNRGAATSIAPYAAGSPPTRNWSPFALDGSLRSDLFAASLVNGVWVTNTAPNQGFWLIGALDEKGGPDRKPSIKHDDAMILQSNFPFDTDITGEGITIAFTPVEPLKPLIRRLRFNLPLQDGQGNSVVEDPGQANYVLSKPTSSISIDRQIILVFARRKAAGQFVYTAEGYPLCKLSDIGNQKRDKTAPDAGPLTYTVLPDPFHVDLDPSNPLDGQLVPALYSEWVSGPAWTAMASTQWYTYS